jgi:hypothetical protein
LINKNRLIDLLVKDVRVVCIAVWVGACVLFAVGLAPVLFEVLPTRELAGAVVNRILRLLNIGGLFVSFGLLLSLWSGGRHTAGRWRAEAVSVSVVALTCAVNQIVIARRIADLRARMTAPIDSLAANDELRIAFGSLHGWSILVLGCGLVAGIVALILIARRETAMTVL